MEIPKATMAKQISFSYVLQISTTPSLSLYSGKAWACRLKLFFIFIGTTASAAGVGSLARLLCSFPGPFAMRSPAALAIPGVSEGQPSLQSSLSLCCWQCNRLLAPFLSMFRPTFRQSNYERLLQYTRAAVLYLLRRPIFFHIPVLFYGNSASIRNNRIFNIQSSKISVGIKAPTQAVALSALQLATPGDPKCHLHDLPNCFFFR